MADPSAFAWSFLVEAFALLDDGHLWALASLVERLQTEDADRLVIVGDAVAGYVTIGSDSYNWRINQSWFLSTLLRINAAIVADDAETGIRSNAEADHHEIHVHRVDRRDCWYAVEVASTVAISSDIDLGAADANSVVSNSNNSIVATMGDFVDYPNQHYYWTVAGWRAVYCSIGDAADSTGSATVGIRIAATTMVAESVTIVTDDNCYCYTATMTTAKANGGIHSHAMRLRPSIFLTVQKHSFQTSQKLKLYLFTE